MRDAAERRHNDWSKALRKRNICRKYYGFEWYDNLHQYSKNKIHCSCPMCRAKSNDRNAKYGSKVNWPMSDKRRFEDMDEQLEEINEEEDI